METPQPESSKVTDGQQALADLISRCRNWATPLRIFLGRYRIIILTAAALFFLVGFLWSATQLELQWSDIAVAPFAILAFAITPIMLAYSAVNMQLMGKAAETKIGFWQGVHISALAQVAELLPIPGAAIVRTAALVKNGARTGQSAGLVLSFAVLWIACAAIGGGIALFHFGYFGVTLLIGGVTAGIFSTAWLRHHSGWKITICAIALRVVGLAIVTARVIATFAIIGAGLEAYDALAFAFAIVLGSAAAIIPAGLGVGEGLSALMAKPTGIAPEAAFLAAAIGRLTGFSVNMSAALIGATFRTAHTQTSA